MADEVEELIRGLRNEDWRIRFSAARSLGEIGDPRAVEPLIAALRDEDWQVRDFATKALGKIGDPRAVEPLITALRDEVWQVQYSATKALSKIGDARAVEPLAAALRGGSSSTREYATKALRKIHSLQLPLLEAFPHVLCEVCHLRAEKKSVRVGIFKKYTYVCCRFCGSSSRLVKGIKEVIGLIGGDVDDYRIDGDKCYVNLWDNENRRARNADIDVLEIRGGSNIDYGLAISSVYTTLVNDASRPEGWIKNIPVVLIGNPPIPRDSMEELEKRFRAVNRGEGYRS